MAGHDDGDRIGPARLRHRACCLRAFDRLCNVEVGPSRSRWNRKKLAPYLALELSALKIQGHFGVELAAGDSFPDGIQGLLERRVVSFYLRLGKPRAQ